MYVELVMFDLDGTLLDTSEGIIESVEYTIDKLGLEKIPRDELIEFIGPPIEVSFREKCKCDSETTIKAASCFREYYSNNALYNAQLYKGVCELLLQLIVEGKRVAIVTYKRDSYAKKLISYFGLDKYCAYIKGTDENGRMSKADIIDDCIRQLLVTTQNSILVGDTKSDLEAAKRTGCRFIPVRYGFGFKNNEDLDSYSVADSTEAILDAIHLFEED